jgi:chromatin remodeling complex protein RSC6
MSSVPAAPKTAKRVAKKTEEVATPVAASTPVAAPVEKKSKKAAAPAAVVPAAAPAVVPAAVPAVVPTAAVEVAEEVRLETEVKALTTRLLAMREVVSELVSEAKRLEKKATKLQKVADKKRRRKAPVEGEEGKPARVSIFQQPTNISAALCAFMGRPAGSQESRSNVTKFITTYVRENNLKDKHDIKADAKLLTLLGLKKEDTLTYFTLQRYLNVHYLNADGTAKTPKVVAPKA